ncbi:MAG: C39 family peptidase [Erythrobacter sp.]|nr:C39 family peptidase [Erythrobacter sp.]
MLDLLSQHGLRGSQFALPRGRLQSGPASTRCMAAVGLACALFAGSPAVAVAREPVASLLEQRRENVVLQQWDISCGAAALATILNHQFDDPVSEREIATSLISRAEYLANPQIIRARLGFSLLDLKRFVDARGYEGIGYGQLDLDQLLQMAPVMVPVELQGYRHFVIFRGVRGNRVLLADPAFGNRTMPIARFEDAWIDDENLGRIGFVVTRPGQASTAHRLTPQDSDFVMLR